MQTGVASEDAMVAVGIDLHVELFAKLYEVWDARPPCGWYCICSDRIQLW